MVVRKILLSIVLLLSLIRLGDSSNSIELQPYSQLQLDANQVPWTRLLFETKSFSVDVSAHVRLESLSADKVKAALIESNQGVAFPIPNAGGYKLSTDTVIDSIFQPPVRIANQVWFDPRAATALGRIRLRQGEDDFKKIYRFTQQGVFRHRIEPKDEKEARKDPEKWTRVKDTFYSYDLAKLGCATISDRLLLVYIAAAVDQFEKDQPVVLCMFGKRQLFQVQLKSAGQHSVKFNFTETKKQAQNKRQGEVKARKILLKAVPLKSDLEKVENFSFLGFHKNIALYIHPTWRVPLQISGKIPVAGKASLKLQEVDLR